MKLMSALNRQNRLESWALLEQQPFNKHFRCRYRIAEHIHSIYNERIDAKNRIPLVGISLHSMSMSMSGSSVSSKASEHTKRPVELNYMHGDSKWSSTLFLLWKLLSNWYIWCLQFDGIRLMQHFSSRFSFTLLCFVGFLAHFHRFSCTFSMIFLILVCSALHLSASFFVIDMFL